MDKEPKFKVGEIVAFAQDGWYTGVGVIVCIKIYGKKVEYVISVDGDGSFYGVKEDCIYKTVDEVVEIVKAKMTEAFEDLKYQIETLVHDFEYE